MIYNKKILAIGAHPDDVELYCGGTLEKARGSSEISVVVCSKGEQKGKHREAEQREAFKVAHINNFWIFDEKDGQITHDVKLIDRLDYIVKKVNPALIFTHYPLDYHQDHAAVGKCATSANRRQLAGLVYFHSHFMVNQPANFFVVVDVKKKKQVLKCFKSQKDEHYMKNIGLIERFNMEYLRC